MKFKILKDEKGSIYIYSILIVFVLTILGVSLIGVATSSFKSGVMLSEKNRAFYMADGAIEEALWQLHADVAAARDEAKDWINNGYRETDEWNDFIDDLYDIEDVTYDYIKEQIEKKLEEEFEEKYFEQLTDGEDGLSKELTEKLENPELDMGSSESSLAELDSVYVKSSVEVEHEDDEGETDKGQRYIEVTLKSVASYNNMEKKAQLALKVLNPGIAKAQSEDYKPFEEKEIWTNDIYMRALTCEGDIVATGGKVNIEGGAYAYGTYPHKRRTTNSEMGGIVSGYSPVPSDFIDRNDYLDGFDRAKLKSSIEGEGSIEIQGKAATKANIQTRHTGSEIDIEHITKNIKRLVLLEDGKYKIEEVTGVLAGRGDACCNSVITSDLALNSNICVGGNIYMYDDMELNAAGAHINVGTADQYGEIWAVLDGDPAGSEADSGFGDRSGSIIVNSEDSAGVDANRIFIAGTAHMNVKDSDDKLYQTGESVSFSKYSYFYQNEYPGEASQPTKAYKDDDGNEYSFLDLTPDFKISHFINYASMNYSDISEKDRSKINVSGIKGAGYSNYSQGAVIANGGVYDPRMESGESILNIESGSFIDEGTFEEQKSENIKKLNASTSILGARDYFDDKNVKGVFEKLVKGKISIVDTEDIENVSIFTDKDVYINSSGAGFEKAGIDISTDGDSAEGIIYTAGNVFIGGEFDFEGTIIAKGNIIFYGPGEKNIKFNIDRILGIIAGNDDIYDFFCSSKADGGKSVTVDDNLARLAVGVESGGEEKSFVKLNEVKANMMFDDIMEFVSWKEVD